jgi:hypothetical protein
VAFGIWKMPRTTKQAHESLTYTTGEPPLNTTAIAPEATEEIDPSKAAQALLRTTDLIFNGNGADLWCDLIRTIENNPDAWEAAKEVVWCGSGKEKREYLALGMAAGIIYATMTSNATPDALPTLR